MLGQIHLHLCEIHDVPHACCFKPSLLYKLDPLYLSLGTHGDNDWVHLGTLHSRAEYCEVMDPVFTGPWRVLQLVASPIPT